MSTAQHSLDQTAQALIRSAPEDLRLTFHVHVPRTAGSALQARWRERGGCFVRLPLEDRADGRSPLDGELRAAAAGGRPVLLSGHHPYRLLRPAVRPGDTLFTAVREPIARAFSLFRYAVSMCSADAILNYPGDPATRQHWNQDWRRNVSARGLDPDGFSLREFLDAALCPDGEYVSYLGHQSDAASLGEEMRDNGFTVLRGRASTQMFGRRPVNRTTVGELAISNTDRALLASRLGEDLEAFASITRAYAPRRSVVGRLRRA